MLVYNWYPAKIFVGDVGTLSIGAILAAASIVGGGVWAFPEEAAERLTTGGLKVVEGNCPRSNRRGRGRRQMDTRTGSAGAHLELVEAELTRIVDFLRRSGAHKIILFGSYARGRRDALVDLDLMVVQKSRLPFVERVARLYRQLAPRVAVDLLVYTPAEWEEMQDRPFIRRALAEGKVLYEKDALRRR